MLPRKRNIGRRRQAGAAAHACTDSAARKAHTGPSGLCVTPLCHAAFSKYGHGHPHRPRRAAKPQGETGGRGGNYFPRVPFLSWVCGEASPAGVRGGAPPAFSVFKRKRASVFGGRPFVVSSAGVIQRGFSLPCSRGSRTTGSSAWRRREGAYRIRGWGRRWGRGRVRR